MKPFAAALAFLWTAGVLPDDIARLFVPTAVDRAVPADDVIGAGYVHPRDGFVFASLKGSYLLTADEASRKRLVDGGAELFKRLLALADARRADRLSGDAERIRNSHYEPRWSDAEEPAAKFARKVWILYFEPARAALGTSASDADVTREAWKRLTQSDPEFVVVGLGGSANVLAKIAYEDARKPGSVRVIGSPALIGHWNPPPEGLAAKFDFTAQTQTVTQIDHFNKGAGYGEMEGRVAALKNFYELPEETQAQRDTRRVKLMLAFGKEKQFEYMGIRPDGLRCMTAEERADAQEAADAVLATLTPESEPTLATAAALAPRKETLVQLFDKVKDSYRYLEVRQILEMARAWSGVGKLSSLDMVTAYEIASREGIDIFAVDAFDDIISTEAGVILWRAVTAGAVIESEERLRSAIDKAHAEARDALLRHKILSDRRRVLSAFLSVQFAHDGKAFAIVRSGIPGNRTVWRRTLGMILNKNCDRLGTAFADAVKDHLETRKVEAMQDYAVDADDVRALHQMIEVLSLIATPR